VEFIRNQSLNLVKNSIPAMIPASKLNGPALAPPPGVIPNFDNPPNQDILIRVLFSIFLGLVTLAVVGRIYIRVFYLKQGFLGDGKLYTD
jgi:hypothetical protein